LANLIRTGRWPRALREAQAIAQHQGQPSPLRALVGQGLMPLLPAPLRMAINRLRGRPDTGSDQSWQE